MGRTPKRTSQLQRRARSMNIQTSDEYKVLKAINEEIEKLIVIKSERIESLEKELAEKQKNFEEEKLHLNQKINVLTVTNTELAEKNIQLKEWYEQARVNFESSKKAKSESSSALLSANASLTHMRRAHTEIRKTNQVLRTENRFLTSKNRSLLRHPASSSITEKRNFPLKAANEALVMGRTPFSHLKNDSQRYKRLDSAVCCIEKIAQEENIKPFLLALNNRIAFKNHQKSMKYSITEMFNIKTELQLSYAQIALLKKKSKSYGCFDPFVSIQKLRALEEHHSRVDLYDIKLSKNTKNKKIVVIEVNNLQKLIGLRLCDLETSGKLSYDIDVLKFTVVGDKGGDTTKVSLIFGDIEKSNSPLHLQLLGMYEGADTQNEILLHLEKMVDQINNFKTISYVNGKGEMVTKTVELQLTGDVMFLCEVLGHKGPNATFNCVLCYNKNCRSNDERTCLSTLDSSMFCHMRSNSSYEQDSRNGDFGVRAGSRVIFFIIPLKNIIPPSLHILMGVVQKYVINVLVKITIELDCKTTFEAAFFEKKLKNDEAVAMIDLQVQNLMIAISIWQKDFEIITNYMLLLLDIERVSQLPPSARSPPCASGICVMGEMLEKYGHESNQMISCAECQRIFHFECVGIFTVDEKHESYNGGRKSCYECQLLSTANVFKSVTVTQATIYGKIEMLKQLVEKYEQSRSQVVSKMGPMQQKLEDTFNSIGAQRKAYYTQSFNGNHLKMLMKDDSIDRIFSIFPDSNLMRELKKIMHLFGLMQRSSVARELTATEISDLEDNIDKLLTSLKLTLPYHSVTPKLHLLLNHVITHVKRFKTWGKMSEQAIEHSHKQITKLQNRNAAIQDPLKRYAAIVKQLTFINIVADTSS